MTSQHFIEDVLGKDPYSMARHQKDDFLVQRLRWLCRHHYENCREYRNIVDSVFGGEAALDFREICAAPYIPVSLFKTHNLMSVPPERVVKTLTSSGTTGQEVSKVFLDAETSRIQSGVLIRIAQHFLGKQRMPMVIIDTPSVLRNRESFSARGAGILGMQQFGRNPFYALHNDMSLDVEGLLRYLREFEGKKVLFFGFTFIVWQYFVRAIERAGITISLDNGILIHSGGWKKLTEISVSPEEFRKKVEHVTGIRENINFYGMVEQVGSIFFENELHLFHAPIYSDVIIRDPITLEPLPEGQVGVAQVVSVLPTSYPGHSILTEDLCAIRGEDSPLLNMKGKFFEVLGRLPKAELRGCSDTFQAAA